MRNAGLTFRGALLALILVGFPLLDANAGSLDGAGSFVVAGMVVDSQSHAPLGHVRVVLAPTTARDQKTEQTTKENGRFSFAVSMAGKYELQITKTGYPHQSYKGSGLSGVSSAIVVRDDQDTGHIVFEAKKAGAISGQIKDEDSEPVASALVALFQSAIIGGERTVVLINQTRANAHGEFRFRGLLRGSYYVCAMGRPWFADSLLVFQDMGAQRTIPRGNAPNQGVSNGESEEDGQDWRSIPYSPDPSFRGTAFSTTFYPSAPTVEAASLVRAEFGTETQISIILPVTKGVSLKGSLLVPGEQKEGRVVLYKKIYKSFMPFLDDWVRNGEFQFTNVPPGFYEIAASSQASSGASSWNIEQTVEVGGSSLELELRPQQMGSYSGHVRSDTDDPLPEGGLFVTLRTDSGRMSRTEAAPDGKFSFERLPPGHFEITAGSAAYIAAYRKGKDGEQLPLTFEMGSGAALEDELVLTSAVSVIEGTVEHEGVPQIGAFVLLLPENRSARWAYRADQTDSDGSFRLATIPAGDYSLIALSEGQDVAFRDAKVAALLSKAAKPVHIEAGKQMELKLDVVGTGTLSLPQ